MIIQEQTPNKRNFFKFIPSWFQDYHLEPKETQKKAEKERVINYEQKKESLKQEIDQLNQQTKLILSKVQGQRNQGYLRF